MVFGLFTLAIKDPEIMEFFRNTMFAIRENLENLTIPIWLLEAIILT